MRIAGQNTEALVEIRERAELGAANMLARLASEEASLQNWTRALNATETAVLDLTAQLERLGNDTAALK